MLSIRTPTLWPLCLSIYRLSAKTILQCVACIPLAHNDLIPALQSSCKDNSNGFCMPSRRYDYCFPPANFIRGKCEKSAIRKSLKMACN